LPEVNTLLHKDGFAVGALVCDSGTPARSLFVMAEGTVKLMRHIPGSREWITVIDLAHLQTVAEVASKSSSLGRPLHPKSAD